MDPVQVKRVFVKTRNVKVGDEMIEGLGLVNDEGVMASLTGEPGTGKTFWSQVRAANDDSVYFRVASIWKKSELDFMQAFCRELGMVKPPGRKGTCYLEAINRLQGTGRTVYVDEVQRLPKDFLVIILDLSDATGCPFVCVGEPELKGMMQAHARVWSRTFYAVEFGPISMSDVIFYGNEAAGLKLNSEIAGILHKASDGDFRIVRRSLIALAQLINAKGPGKDGEPQITGEMARIAVKAGLSGSNGGNGNGRTAKR